MTTLIQARAALAVAQRANTKSQWQAAALALAAVLASAPALPMPAPSIVVAMPLKKRARRTIECERHAGKTPIPHVGRCTLADGYSARVSCWQFKGDTVADALARLERFTIASWRNHRVASDPRHGRGATCYGLAWNYAMEALTPPAVLECRIVKHGTGARAGIDLECPVVLAA